MDKQFFIELTNDLYRLTILFPEEEPLRLKLRDRADDILSDLVTILEGDSEEKREAAKKVERKLGILESMLEIAEDQKWVKKEKFADIRENYKKIKEEIKKFNRLQKEKARKPERTTERKLGSGKKSEKPAAITSLNDRQRKIIKIMEKSGKVQVSEVLNSLENRVTKRTLRRDFKKLMEMNLVERIGKANFTRYQLKE